MREDRVAPQLGGGLIDALIDAWAGLSAAHSE
jgi:hypothetical protein